MGRLLLVLSASLALSGCLIGPDYAPPPASLATQWGNAGDPAVDTTRQEYRDWWRVFDDPVLETLIDTAYRQNLDLRMAGVRVLQSRAELGLAIGELYSRSRAPTSPASASRCASPSRASAAAW